MGQSSNCATIFNTESHELFSRTVKDTFKIDIALPKDYDRNNGAYPVLYLTDGNIFFGLVTETLRLLQFGKELPDMIVVGIGYPDDSAHLSLRNRDLTPTPYNVSGSAGRASDFLDFISNELKPFIEEKYAVDKNNCNYAGDSLGGLFGLYVLFNRPEEFQRYIIASPSIYWDESVIFQQEKAFWESGRTPSAKVFLSAGELEAIYEPEFAGMLSNAAKMIERLNSRKYPDFHLKSHIFHNETHLSVIPAAFSRGLREVFSS